MARLIYSESAFADFERIFECYSKADPELAAEVVSLIQDAVLALELHPMIGRGVEAGLQDRSV